MRKVTTRSRRLAALMPLSAALALTLAACGQAEDEDVTVEPAVEDVGGGELIVTEDDPNVVDVTLPETPMVNVDEGADAAATEAEEPAAE